MPALLPRLRPYYQAASRALLRLGGVVLGLVLLTPPAWAQAVGIDAPTPGLNETGVPAFIIRSSSSLGLSSPPTDLQPLPDGRVVALAGRELALGDGTRWEVYRLAPEQSAASSSQMAIDASGAIYVGTPGAFDRITFGVDGFWRRETVGAPPDPAFSPATVATVPGQWYWHGGDGTVCTWRPGIAPRELGKITDLERALVLGGTHYLSDRADGSFWRVTPTGLEPAISARTTNVSYTVTCGLDLGGGNLLVGTNRHGLQRFADGAILPYLPSGPLAGLNRINDLCATVPDRFAAAVDNVGLVFFDRDGRTVQMLDRSLDHRLARVRRLFFAPHGVVWGLLNDGVVQVEFPARLSHYEPLVSTALGFVQPFRFQGRLWLLCDGLAQRGVYDADGRLLRFEIDSPADEFLCSLSTATGTLLAGGRAGIFRREAAGWSLVVPGVSNAHLVATPDPLGRWAFFAENSAGWLRPTGDTYEVRTVPAPGLGGVYGAIEDNEGRLWAELGTARSASLELVGDEIRVTRFEAADGLAGGWVQLALLDGEIRANVGGRFLRLDPATRRFVPDLATIAAIPEAAADLVGRPGVDALGRHWFGTSSRINLYERRGRGFRRLEESFPPGLHPIVTTPEAGGPVWLHQRLQLARYDPAVPLPAPASPRALLTRIHLPNTSRTLFPTRDRLAPLPFADNSLVFDFVAIEAPPSQTVTFEVQLDGAASDWVATGVVGSAVFNRLKEGAYVFRVRPLLDGTAGEEARIAFAIAPPWFRTHTAYALYTVAALAFIGLVAWYATWRERRDKSRLERLVAQRTAELNNANRQLAANMDETLQQASALRASEERFRQLSTELERRIRERTEALVRSNEQLVASNQELEAFSYSVSHDLRAPLRNINGFVDLLRRRNRGTLDAESSRFFQIIATETIRLSQLIDSLLAFARLNRADLRPERIALAALVTQVIAELRPEFENRLVEWKIGALPIVSADTALLRQVVANLLHNAIKFTRHRQPAVIEIGAQPFDDTNLAEHVVFVRDNGAGFDPQYAAKLFGVFQRLHNVRDFEGSGIGLANAKRIILRHGGRMWAEGTPGHGATFFFSLPVRRPSAAQHSPPAPA